LVHFQRNDRDVVVYWEILSAFVVDPKKPTRHCAKNLPPKIVMLIPPTWILPDAMRIRLGQTTYGRQRAIVEENYLLLVLHRPPGPNDAKREGVLFLRNPDGGWQCNREGSGPGALKRHVQAYADIEAKLTQTCGKAVEISDLFDLVETLTPLTRAARNMHHALQIAREAIKNDGFLIEMRDLGDELDRNFELLLEDVRNAIQYRTVREAEEQARLSKEALRASHRLNTLAALFFPLTAIASLFGMQLAHGFNEHDPSIFWIIFAVAVGLGFGMKSWVLGNQKVNQPPRKE
jgi:hypothetical protein